MFDEMDRLRSSELLYDLLERYVTLGKEDRQIWQERFLEVDGIEGKELTRAYGELIAYGWIEQNTGATPVLELGKHMACYRVTTGGQKAWKEIRKEKRQQETIAVS